VVPLHLLVTFLVGFIDLRDLARLSAESRLKQLLAEIAEIQRIFPGLGATRHGRPRAADAPPTKDDRQTRWSEEDVCRREEGGQPQNEEVLGRSSEAERRRRREGVELRRSSCSSLNFEADRSVTSSWAVDAVMLLQLSLPSFWGKPSVARSIAAPD
jgi:hypothetical protein